MLSLKGPRSNEAPRLDTAVLEWTMHRSSANIPPWSGYRDIWRYHFVYPVIKWPTPYAPKRTY